MNHREMMRRRFASDGRSPVASMDRANDEARPSAELRIEHLVLDGFSPADRQPIADAVQSELARLLGEQGLPSAIRGLSDLERLNGGTISLTRGARGGAIGSQIAHAVHHTLTNGESENSRRDSAVPTRNGTLAKR